MMSAASDAALGLSSLKREPVEASLSAPFAASSNTPASEDTDRPSSLQPPPTEAQLNQAKLLIFLQQLANAGNGVPKPPPPAAPPQQNPQEAMAQQILTHLLTAQLQRQHSAGNLESNTQLRTSGPLNGSVTFDFDFTAHFDDSKEKSLWPPTPNNNLSVLTSTPHPNAFASPSVQSLNSAANTPNSEIKRVRKRPCGASVKTAEVWRFFVQRPDPEQAATCSICQKIIKATNSSTTGMIRHLRSCHHQQHTELQRARQENQIRKAVNLGITNDVKMNKQLIDILSTNAANKLSGPPTMAPRQNPAILSNGQFNSSLSPHSTASSSNVSTLENSTINSSYSLSSAFERPASASSKAHSIDALLFAAAERQDAVSPVPTATAHVASSLFITPTKYLTNYGSVLRGADAIARQSLNETAVSEDVEPLDEQDENINVEAASESSLPKRPKFMEEADVEEEEDEELIVKHEHKHIKHIQIGSESIDQQIALMLAVDNLPPSVVEQPGFRSLFAHILPGYSLPSAALFEQKLLPKALQRLPSDLETYRQKLTENNGTTTGHGWPISPSTTVESGVDDMDATLSDTASSSAAARSAILNQSFTYSIHLHTPPSRKVDAMPNGEDSSCASSVESFPLGERRANASSASSSRD